MNLNIDSAAPSVDLRYHDGLEAWQQWFESRLAEEREYTSSLMMEVLRGLVADLNARIDKAVLEVRMAARPFDGRDGRGFNIRGTWDRNERYFALDVVILSGGSFAARRDNPGDCPGEGWQLIAAQGKRGIKGEPGAKGEPGDRSRAGEDAPTIEDWQINAKTYSATPVLSNGKLGPALELRGLFEQFLQELDQ
jgi:hypothetical protein